MDIKHPCLDPKQIKVTGDWKVVITPELAAAVKAIKALPKIAQKGRVEWAKDSTMAPAGEYTDPSTEAAAEAVKTLGRGYGRRRSAVALGFRTTHDYDAVLSRLDMRNKRAPKVAEAPKEETPKPTKAAAKAPAAKRAPRAKKVVAEVPAA